MTECRDWSDEEVIEWLREHYPQFADESFVEVGRRVLRRIFCQDSSSGSVVIADLPKVVGQWVTLGDVIVVEETGERRYVGCSVCGRKNCDRHPDAGTEEYVVFDYQVADKTGMCRVGLVCKSSNIVRLKTGQVVRLWGRVSEWRGKYELTVYDVDRIVIVREAVTEPPPAVKATTQRTRSADERVDKIVRAVRTAQASGSPMSRKQFESLCGKFGLSADEVVRSGAVRVDGSHVIAGQ